MDFPGNSHNVAGTPKPEKEPKVVEKVTTAEVVQKKKSVGRRFKAIFIRGEFKGAARYVLTDVLVPAFKNMLVDAGTEGLKRTVYGESSVRRRGYDPGRPRISYNSPVDRFARRPGMLPDQPPVYQGAPRRGPRQEVGDFYLISRDEADTVLEGMQTIIDKYEVVSVADLHELVGLPSTHVDNKWGWSNIASAAVRQTRDGWLLDLPPVEPI